MHQKQAIISQLLCNGKISFIVLIPDVNVVRGRDSKFGCIGIGVLCGGTGGGGSGTSMSEFLGLGLTQSGSGTCFRCTGSESTDRVIDSGVSALLIRTPLDFNFFASSLLVRIVRRFWNQKMINFMNLLGHKWDQMVHCIVVPNNYKQMPGALV